MSITALGKTLVIVNLILSLVFASWAMGVFTNRIDWPGGGAPTVPGERALGEIGKRKAEIDEYTLPAKGNRAGLALGNWRAWTDALTTLETVERPRARAWFTAKLKGLEDGQGPITALVYGSDGRLQIGADGKPILGPDGQPLRSRATARQAIAATDAQIKEQTDQANRDLKAAEELTIQINGIREGNLVKQKGLRDLLAEEELARRNALAEIEYVRPFRFNRQAEGELLQKRQASLGQRLEELKKVSTASR